MSDFNPFGQFLSGYSSAQQSQNEDRLAKSNELWKQAQQELAKNGILIKQQQADVAQARQQASENYLKGKNELGNRKQDDTEKQQQAVLNQKAEQFYAQLNGRIKMHIDNIEQKNIQSGFPVGDAKRIAMEGYFGKDMKGLSAADVDTAMQKDNEARGVSPQANAQGGTLGASMGARPMPVPPPPQPTLGGAYGAGPIDPNAMQIAGNPPDLNTFTQSPYDAVQPTAPMTGPAQAPGSTPAPMPAIGGDLTMPATPAPSSVAAPAGVYSPPPAQAAGNPIATMQGQIQAQGTAPVPPSIVPPVTAPTAPTVQMPGMPTVQDYADHVAGLVSPMAKAQIAQKAAQTAQAEEQTNYIKQKGLTAAAMRDPVIALTEAKTIHLNDMNSYMKWQQQNGDAVRNDLARYRDAQIAGQKAQRALELQLGTSKAMGADRDTSFKEANEQFNSLQRASNQLMTQYRGMSTEKEHLSKQLADISVIMNMRARPNPLTNKAQAEMYDLYKQPGPNGIPAGEIRKADIQHQLGQISPLLDKAQEDMATYNAMLSVKSKVLNAQGRVDNTRTNALQSKGNAILNNVKPTANANIPGPLQSAAGLRSVPSPQAVKEKLDPQKALSMTPAQIAPYLYGRTPAELSEFRQKYEALKQKGK